LNAPLLTVILYWLGVFLAPGEFCVKPRSTNGPGSGVDSLPILIECDQEGHVIWLSERARSIVGAPANLTEILEARSGNTGIPLRVYRVLRAPDGLLWAAEAEMPVSAYGFRHGATLHQLELRLLSNYFRLLRIERRLARKAARKKRGKGGAAIRQIELERRRISSELHTGVGQMLAAIRLQLEVVASNLKDPPVVVRQALTNLAALAAGALDQVRSVSRRLHPPDWQRLTIEEALRQLWEISGIPLSYDAHIDLVSLSREPDLEIKALIYRTAQEALSNISGHSNARKVAMSLESHGDRLILTLLDDGVGFDTALLTNPAANPPAGIGLRSLEEQASAAGAKIDVESGPNGTRLKLITQYKVES